MRSAPTVQFPLGRSSWGALLSSLPAVIGLGVGLVWMALGTASLAQTGGMLVLVGLGGAAAWRWGAWHRQGSLAWNGREWVCERAGAALPLLQLRVRWDGQRFLLLQAQTAGGGSLWLWVEQRMAPVLWHRLRQAIFLPGTIESLAEESSE